MITWLENKVDQWMDWLAPMTEKHPIISIPIIVVIAFVLIVLLPFAILYDWFRK